MTSHFISIIVPIYNCEQWVRPCIDSLLNLDKPASVDCEIVIVDDGSTDGSPSICDEYAQSNPCVKVYHTENHGVSHARNYALSKVQGGWIMFVDGDDVLRQDTLQVLSLHNCFRYDIIRFGAYEFTKDWSRSFRKAFSFDKDKYLQHLVHRIAMLGVCGALYKRSLFEANNIQFSTDIRSGEDWLVLFKLLVHASSFTYVNEELYGYRLNEQSVTHKLHDEVWTDAARAFNAILEYAQKYNVEISSKDIAIARSELRRNMMKTAILKKNKSFYKDTDIAIKQYLPQSFWKDIVYSKKIKHKIGFLLYHIMDFVYTYEK